MPRKHVCIYCQCTEARACQIPRDELDVVAQEALLERFGVDRVDQLPRFIPCWWVSTSPPVCSAPACVKKYQRARRNPSQAAKR